MSRKTGTALRHRGHYIIPGEETVYPAVSTILENVDSPAGPAAAWWMGEATAELVELAKNKQPAYYYDRVPVLGDDGEKVGEDYVTVECSPIDILSNPNLMTPFYYRRLRVAQDRGTGLHAIAQKWGEGDRWGLEDVGTLAEQAVIDHRLICPVDELAGYAYQLTRWLITLDPTFLVVEGAVFDRMVGYAGSLDMIVVMPGGKVFVVDIKTSRSVSYRHIMQVCAYKHAEWAVGPDGVVRQNLMKGRTSYVGAAILKVTQENAMFRPVRDTARHYSSFKGIARMYHRSLEKKIAMDCREFSVRSEKGELEEERGWTD